MASYIFLSSAEQDAIVMQKLRDRLFAHGLQIVIDNDIVTRTPLWRDAIIQSIQNATAIIIILSPAALKSERVNLAIGYANTLKKETNIGIFPVLARGNERNAMPIALVQYPYLDMRDSSVFEERFRELIFLLGKHLNQIILWQPPPQEDTVSWAWLLLGIPICCLVNMGLFIRYLSGTLEGLCLSGLIITTFITWSFSFYIYRTQIRSNK